MLKMMFFPITSRIPTFPYFSTISLGGCSATFEAWYLLHGSVGTTCPAIGSGLPRAARALASQQERIASAAGHGEPVATLQGPGPVTRRPIQRW